MRAIAAAVVLCACGPSLATLAEHRHYREAICGAHDGSARDRDALGAALDADAALAVHVQTVSPGELAHVIDDVPAVAQRARFARIEVQTNALPVDGLTITPAFDDGTTRIAALVDWQVLALLTGERLPPKNRATTYLTGGNVLRGLVAVATAGVAPLLAAASGHPFTFEPAETLEEPTDPEYAKTAPRAYALHHAMEWECTGSGPPSDDAIGKRCTWYFAIDREARGTAELSLRVRYRANRVHKHDDARDDAACVVERVARISLGDAADLDATIERMFGARMRDVRDLRTTMPR